MRFKYVLIPFLCWALVCLGNVCMAQVPGHSRQGTSSSPCKPCDASKFNYIDTVKKALQNCSECDTSNGFRDLLIYDAKYKRFLYTDKNGNPQLLRHIDDFPVYYKKPFQVKIINLNRYLYNVNFETSDLTFASHQSQLLSDNLLHTDPNATPAAANTFANGASVSEGDQIFVMLTAFKPELDRLYMLLDQTLTVIINQVRQAMKASLNNVQKSLAAGNGKNGNKQQDASTFRAIKLLNNYNQELDVKTDKLSSIVWKMNQLPAGSDLRIKYSQEYELAYTDFEAKANSIVKEIDNGEEAAFKKIREDKKYLEFKTLVANISSMVPASPDSVGVGNNPVEIAYQEFKKRVDTLEYHFGNLESYYNSFIDDKIKAYSVCTEQFTCCEATAELTYAKFNDLLTDANKSFREVRHAADNLDKAMADQKEAAAAAAKLAAAATPAPAAAKPAPAAKTPDVMKVTAADFTFDKEGKIIGIKLAQGGDAAKPDATKKPTDDVVAILPRIDSIAVYWAAFEKLVSPEFIMRRILFKRNMVSANMGFTSPPVYPYGDRIRLAFTISTSDSARRNGVSQGVTTSLSQDFRVRGKWQFNFSAGTFVGIGGQLKGPTAEFRQVPAAGTNTVDANSPYKLVGTGSGSVPIGAVGMANLLFPVYKTMHLGPSIGAGVTVAPGIKVAYMGGISIAFGSYHQFQFTGGAIALNVDQLKDNYKTSSTLYTSIPSGSVYTQQVKPGFFLAFTYTIFDVKASGQSKDGLLNGANVLVK